MIHGYVREEEVIHGHGSGEATYISQWYSVSRSKVLKDIRHKTLTTFEAVQWSESMGIPIYEEKV